MAAAVEAGERLSLLGRSKRSACAREPASFLHSALPRSHAITKAAKQEWVELGPGGACRPNAQQQGAIRVVHIFAPKVIKTDVENFRALVQRLTGHRKRAKGGGGNSGGREPAPLHGLEDVLKAKQEVDDYALSNCWGSSPRPALSHPPSLLHSPIAQHSQQQQQQVMPMPAPLYPSYHHQHSFTSNTTASTANSVIMCAHADADSPSSLPPPLFSSAALPPMAATHQQQQQQQQLVDSHMDYLMSYYPSASCRSLQQHQLVQQQEQQQQVQLALPGSLQGLLDPASLNWVSEAAISMIADAVQLRSYGMGVPPPHPGDLGDTDILAELWGTLNHELALPSPSPMDSFTSVASLCRAAFSQLPPTDPL